GGDLAGLGDVLDRNADVFRRVIDAAQLVDVAGEGAEQLGGLLGAAVADDDRLAAAHLEVGDRILVAHALRQAQHVLERLGAGGVVPHAGAADGRTARGGVNGDNRPQAGLFIKDGVDAFVVREGRGIEERLTHKRRLPGYFLLRGRLRAGE